MLAQAQKCFYEKATRAGMKDSIVAKIAAECSGNYNDASLRLNALKLSSKSAQEWLDFADGIKGMIVTNPGRKPAARPTAASGGRVRRSRRRTRAQRGRGGPLCGRPGAQS